jgi:NtrC-family two-component system response regulator AlgB
LDFINSYPWPGNLRELRNAIERATILCADRQINRCDFPSNDSMLPIAGQQDSFSEIRPGGEVTLNELESEHIKRIVERVSNLNDAARILGIDKATLYRKRKRMNMA